MTSLIPHAPPPGRRVVCFTFALALVVATGCAGESASFKPKANTSTIAQPLQAPQWTSQDPLSATPPRLPASQPTAVVHSANHDSCALKLHDLCGPLLLYYSLYNRLPQSLDELRQLPGFENLGDFNCPASGRPYIYTPQGEPGPQDELVRQTGPAVTVPSIIILADPAVHGGIRWALSMQEPDNPGKGFVAKVIVLPSSRSR